MSETVTESTANAAKAAHSPIGHRAAPWQPTTLAWLCALLGWTLLLCFYDLEGGARFEPTDCWVAQSAREMYHGSGWRSLLVPVFSGETRMQKSPGPYWAVMLTTWLRGRPDVDEVSARIPNGLAGLMLVVTIFWLTRRIAGDRAAIFAGFAASASVLILYWSHRAASDLGLTAFTTIALVALWVAAEQEPPGRKRTALWLIGYLAAGLGMLYKLPMPLVVVGAPALVYLVVKWRWRVLRDRVHLWGLLVFLAPWLPWAVAVLLIEPAGLAKWKAEFWDRFTGSLPNIQGQRAWYYHFIYLVPPIVYCLPFSLSLPRAFWRIFRPPGGADRNGLHFMLIWFVVLFVFFTAAAGKELRYFLPALPPLFVLLGIELSCFFDPARQANPARDRLGAWAVWILIPLGFAGGLVGVYHWYTRTGELEGFAWADVWPPYIVTAVIFTGGAALAAWLYRRRREYASFATLVAAMWLTWCWVWSAAMPVFVSQRPFLDFAAQLQDKIPPALQSSLRQVGSQDSRIIWYSDCRFPRIIDQLELLRREGHRRSLERELELIGEEMVRQLSGEEPVLMVASRPHYVDFLVQAPPRLAQRGQTMPPVHLWLQTRLGPASRHFVVFGNRPPPWPEPQLTPPSKRLEAARAAGDRAATAGSPVSQPTDGH